MTRVALVGVALLASACRRGAAPRDAPAAAELPAAPREVPPPPRPREAPPAPARPSQFRLDPSHTGRSGYRLPRTPRVLARLHTGGRVSAQVIAADDDLLVVGSHDGVVYGLTATLRRRWRVATGDRVYSTALSVSEGLYVGSDVDRFLSLDRRGGVRVALATEDDADTAATAAPDGSLRFASGRTVYAAERDLTVRWRFDAGSKVFSSPAVTAEGGAVFGSQDDHLYALGADGALRWRVRTGGDVDATPALDAAGNVYVGSDDGHVYSVAPDGALRWRRSVGGYVRAGAALGLDRTLVVGTFGPRVRVVALDMDDGRERWSLAIPSAPTRDVGVASAALVDREGWYAVGAPDDRVYILDALGRVVHSVQLGADVDSPPVLLRDGVIAVGCDDGDVYLLGEGEFDACVTSP
ncbi:MAG: PQQ-binding-like beta-propeller repeat protein [Polyangiales bacterium]